MTLAFVFEITNPNKYAVKLDSSQFSLYFEDYELRVVNDSNVMWIPAETTNMKVMTVTLTPFSTFTKFLLAHKVTAEKRGDKPWDLIEKWWTALPDMSFPVKIKEGAFVFAADGVVKVVAVDITYP